MRVVPAIDLREGACVQLVGGSYARERVRLDDPVAAALGFARAGFRRLHVVDLDAATGRGSNRAVVGRLLAALPGAGCEVQVGGGVRDAAAVEELLAAGAARVVVGTRALEDPAWLAGCAHRFPGRIVAAADARGREVVGNGWSRGTGRDVLEAARDLAALPIAALLVTAVHREGRLAGTDRELVRALLERRVPLVAAGGIATRAELDALAALGCREAIVGMALYTGALDPAELAREYAA